MYGIWVDRGRGIVVCSTLPVHHSWAGTDGTGLALLDILSVQLWEADSARMAWASYVKPYLALAELTRRRLRLGGQSQWLYTGAELIL